MRDKRERAKVYWRSLVILTIVGLSVTACTLPIQSASNATIRTWIDQPLDGSVLPLGPVEVISHGSAADGVSEMVLLVNGDQIRVDAATQVERLSTFSQIWDPDEPGSYTLIVMARTAAGAEVRSQPVRVRIGGEVEIEEPPTEESTAISTPEEVTATPTPTEPGEACTDRIDFAGETIPDDTVFLPGMAFTKSWTLVNAGTCNWTTEYALTFLAGNRMGAPASIGFPQAVEPGGAITFSVDMTAPSQSGEHLGTWMLRNAEGETFGLGDDAALAFWVSIIVQSATPTPTATMVPVAPNAPSDLQITSSVCDGSGLSVTLNWTDNSGNESGFRVYRDGGLIATLGANVTTYDDDAPHKNSAYTYAVEAYNGAGTSAQDTVNSQICPVP
jgi:hypothetical protein